MPVADAVAAYIDEPLAVYTAAVQARGESPLWNPHNALGVPLMGNWQTSIPSPLRLLVHWFPDSPTAFDITYLLRLLVAGSGALLLALHLGTGAVGARRTTMTPMTMTVTPMTIAMKMKKTSASQP